MNALMALTRVEARRVLRNKRYLIFTLVLPVGLFLSVGKSVTHATAYGVAYGAYYMVAMCVYGTMSGSLINNSMRISQERKDGWIRQLRLTSLPASSYVVSKIIASMVTTVPSVVIVLCLGRFYDNIDLPIWKFVVIGLAVWLGSLTFAALAVAIGYRFAPDVVQPVVMIVYFLLAVLGGIFFAVSGVLRDIGKVLPTYQIVNIGTEVLGKGSVPASSVIGLVVWLLVFVGLAALAVRSTAERV